MKSVACMLIDPPTMAVNVSDTDIQEAMEALTCSPPIGLYYLAAYLRENGVEVSILDAKSLDMSHEEVHKVIQREEPDLVGVEVFTTQLRSARILCQGIRERFPETKTVLGGPHIHSQYDEIIKEDWVDFCVRGEGESTFLELVQAISNGGGYEGVKGISFKKGGEVIVTPFPGTALYRECKEKGLLRSENLEEHSYFHPGNLAIRLAIPDDEFKALYEKAHREYYYRHIRDRVKQEMVEIY